MASSDTTSPLSNRNGNARASPATSTDANGKGQGPIITHKRAAKPAFRVASDPTNDPKGTSLSTPSEPNKPDIAPVDFNFNLPVSHRTSNREDVTSTQAADLKSAQNNLDELLRQITLEDAKKAQSEAAKAAKPLLEQVASLIGPQSYAARAQSAAAKNARAAEMRDNLKKWKDPVWKENRAREKKAEKEAEAAKVKAEASLSMTAKVARALRVDVD